MNTELTRQTSWHTNGIKQFISDESIYFTHEHSDILLIYCGSDVKESFNHCNRIDNINQ